jgi:hypothetical protein
MSSRYADAGVEILKRTVSPRLTLIAVEKPWMELSPPSVTSHSLAGAPARKFSHTIGLLPQPCASVR